MNKKTLLNRELKHYKNNATLLKIAHILANCTGATTAIFCILDFIKQDHENTAIFAYLTVLAFLMAHKTSESHKEQLKRIKKTKKQLAKQQKQR